MENHIVPLGMIIGEKGDYQINIEEFENFSRRCNLVHS
jgi:hypothetical protein